MIYSVSDPQNNQTAASSDEQNDEVKVLEYYQLALLSCETNIHIPTMN